MINLKPAIDCDVHVQFKHAIYVMAVTPRGFVPLSLGEQGQQQSPALVDFMDGRLRQQDDQFVLTYANPANPSEQIDYFFDPEDVNGVWVQRKVTLVSGNTLIKQP